MRKLTSFDWANIIAIGVIAVTGIVLMIISR